MTFLRDDTFSRRGEAHGAHRRNSSGIMFFVLCFISLALLVLSKLDHVIVHMLRTHIVELAAPVLNKANGPILNLRRIGRQLTTYVKLNEELQRLKSENRILLDQQWRAKMLQRRLARLGKMVRVVKDRELDFITARVIGDASGPFARAALVRAGTVHGVQRGFPVFNNGGLIGRIVEAGPSTSRLLLLSDLNSRVPVSVGGQGKRALMLGDNSAAPRLGYLPHGTRARQGEDVYTSGVGGLFPQGLRIGKVSTRGGKAHVDLSARFDNLDFVTVLFYLSPNLVHRSGFAAISSASLPIHETNMQNKKNTKNTKDMKINTPAN